ncbi:MAG: DUF2764 family protein [Chlorobi bacterium]|nr:DUF2764 family protein [Chlorobiota bacterium]
MTRNYYCLVAGLPDLIMEDRKLAFSSASFRELLQQDVHPQDYKLVGLFFLPFDHMNIISRLYDDEPAFDNRGNYTEEEIEELTNKKSFETAEGFNMPEYIISFMEDFFGEEEKPAKVDSERRLTKDYYNHLQSTGNDFLNNYVRHELNLRNVLTALNGRKFNMDVSADIIGDSDIEYALRKSRTRDFGLANDVDNLEAIIQLHEIPNLLERELKLDTIRWQFLDEATFFNYFTIEKVLAFVIKVFIVERWLSLDAEKGKELFEQLIKDLENSYEFPEEFILSHG